MCLRLTGSLVGVWLVSAAALAQQGSVVVLGDSNTAGFGVGSAQAFPSQLNAMLQRRGHNTTVVNAGVSGDTLGGMLGRLDSSVPAGTRLVIVQGGYNDKATGTPPDVIIARMKGILAQLRARRVAAVLCGFFYPEWDAIGRKVAATYGATFVPGSTCYDPRNRGFDGLHMSAAGHTVVAGRLTPVVEKILYRPGPASAHRAGKGAAKRRQQVAAHHVRRSRTSQ
jgi:acyl-CoA thioesterase-1